MGTTYRGYDVKQLPNGRYASKTSANIPKEGEHAKEEDD